MIKRTFPTLLVGCALLAGVASCASDEKAPSQGKSSKPMANPEPQMQAVLDKHAELGPKPITSLPAAEARRQPSPADAVKALLQAQGKDASPQSVGDVQDRTIPGPAGAIQARVYSPKGDGPFPVLVYFHGGGWVIADLDTYDATPRALVNLANCVVVSAHYRQGPEHKFPAAHDDAYAALQWVMTHAAEVKGDPRRVAVGGESAGGNLAIASCLMARDRGGKMPVHQLLVYPIANYGFDTPSYQENAQAKPLDRDMMKWFFKQYLNSPSDGENEYVSPLRANLKGLPPATMVMAEIDPLRSEGQMLAEKLRKDGVRVRDMTYNGVTHEFFGMAAVVDKAKQAEQFAADGLKASFGQ